MAGRTSVGFWFAIGESLLINKLIVGALMLWSHLMDALLGYPKEYTVYPDGAEVTIRHQGGLWTLKPAYTYQRRRMSFIKHNYRYGWNVVSAPDGYVQYVGRDNLTEEPGVAIRNMIDGQEMMNKLCDQSFNA